MKRLVLVDGNAILHRAYHALPPLTTSKGELVNAVFGFCSMLLKVIADLKPTHLAVAFDRPEPTFRKKMFAAYQAQRPVMEEELVSQVDLVKKVVKTMEVPIYEKVGFEADDIIGTLARQAAKILKRSDLKEIRPPKEKKVETVIVTGDQDILQLVDEDTKVYMPVKGLSLAKLYGKKEVKEKFGIDPDQIVDFKALVGDPSDNYPGVKGIGPKNASNLLKSFKNLEVLYKNLNKIDKKTLARALKKHEKEAEMAKKLAKIVTNTPVKLDLKKARLGKLDTLQVRKLFVELEFKSLIPRLSGDQLQTKQQKKIKIKEKKNEQLQWV